MRIRMPENFIRRIRSGLAPERLVPDLTAGLVVGLMNVAVTVSLAALIFSGDLSPFLAHGVGLALLSSVLIGGVVAVMSSLPGMVADVQDAPAAVLAVTAVSIAAAMPAAAVPEATFMTVVATLGLSTVLTALLLLTVAQLRLGRLVRYLPQSVVGGFLAGTGWLLFTGGMAVMAGVHTSPSYLNDLFAHGVWLRWLPGLAFALAIAVVSHRIHHYLVWPGLLIGGIAAVFLVMLVSGGSPAEWRADGLLLGPFPDGTLYRPVDPSELRMVRWPLVIAQAAGIATVMFLTLMSVLFNTTGMELALGRDIDLDRELRAAGIGNLLAGAMGGMIGYHLLSLTVLNHRVGRGSRLSVLVGVAVAAATLVFGATVVALMPTVIVGGLLVYFGYEFLHDWVYRAWFTMPRLEYGIVLSILLVITTVGFLQGVGVGLVLAVLLFVVAYSRVDAVRNALSGVHVRSRVSRPDDHRRYLEAHGDELLILHLQGFLFFGTVAGLRERIEARLERSPAPRAVLLDFRRVTGLDATALAIFTTLVRLAGHQNTTLILCDLAPDVARQLQHQGVIGSSSGPVRVFPTLDAGLEWSEEQVLATRREAATPADPATRFDALLGEGHAFDELLPYLDRIEMSAGHRLLRQGDAPDVLYFVLSGQVTACLEADDAPPVRLETMRSGSLVGELGFYSGKRRSASVVADRASTVLRLTRASLARMTEEEPGLAAALHELVVRLLAGRVTHLMTAVQALQR